MIANETELEDILSRPSEHDIAAMKLLGGDLLILGAGGKMGPTLALRAQRAAAQAKARMKVIAVARFSSARVRSQLDAAGIETISADLLEPGALDRLPDAPNVIFMAAMKFGTSGAAYMTWAMNTFLPGLVAHRYRDARIVAFSSGNVYPLVPVNSGGATESTLPEPVGEYAQSVLGRERMFEYGSYRFGTKVCLLRLNYATELRYGVLVDIGQKVLSGTPVDLAMGHANVIWQGDANSVCLRSFEYCSAPPFILNMTGPETLSVRWVAEEFGRKFGVEPLLRGKESSTALLNNAEVMVQRFGAPEVSVPEMIAWIAGWLRSGGSTHGKPTHFEQRDGRF